MGIPTRARRWKRRTQPRDDLTYASRRPYPDHPLGCSRPPAAACRPLPGGFGRAEVTEPLASATSGFFPALLWNGSNGLKEGQQRWQISFDGRPDFLDVHCAINDLARITPSASAPSPTTATSTPCTSDTVRGRKSSPPSLVLGFTLNGSFGQQLLFPHQFVAQFFF